jgi:hypothetical protein
MRQLLLIALTALTVTPAWCQEQYAVGKPLPGPLFVYAVSPSGEIGQVQQMPEQSWGAKVLMDRAGRLVVIRGFAGELHLYRIAPDRSLSLMDSIVPPANSGATQSLALSQDGRLILSLFIDFNVDPRHLEFQTFLVNNRLGIVPTGFALDADDLGGVGLWTLSDRGPYTAILSRGAFGQPGEFLIFSISPSGEITDTGQRVATPVTHNLPFHVSPTGEIVLNGRQTGADSEQAVYTVSADGTVTLKDAASPAGMTFTYVNLLTPDRSMIVTSGSPGIFTIALSASLEIGAVLDQETPAFGLTQGLAVSPDGKIVLVDDQAPGFDFPLFSHFLAPDGELTPTGHSLSRPDHHADLRFIPPPTPSTLLGDANLDSLVDVADVVFLINEALPDDKPILLPQNFANADLDGDIDVDRDDLDALLDLILARP